MDLPRSQSSVLTHSSRRRRDRLSDLSRDADPTVWEERRRAMRALLAKPLLVENGIERTLVNRHKEWLSLWLSHYPGWELQADADAARLVKRPARLDDSSRPCRDPSQKDIALTRRGYAFLCLTLSILVRENRQVTLKNIAESLAGISRAEPVFHENGLSVDLDLRPVRRDLVQALRVLLDWRVLKRVAGHEDGFVGEQGADALYNINRPILSRLHASRQSPSLVAATDFDTRLRAIAFGRSPFAESDPGTEGRNREIRFSLYRRLLDDPVLYLGDLTEDEREYLDKQRTFICQQIEQAAGLVPEVRAEGLAMVDPLGGLSDYSLPETGTDGHVALLVATWLADRLRAGRAEAVSLTELQRVVRGFADQNKNWRKDARAPGAEVVLVRDTVRRLQALGLARLHHDPVPAVTPLPAIGRFGLRETETGDNRAEEHRELF